MKIVVTHCGMCPFEYDGFACTHVSRSGAHEDRNQVYEHTSDGEGVPSWCPLYKGSVEIVLADAATEED